VVPGTRDVGRESRNAIDFVPCSIQVLWTRGTASTSHNGGFYLVLKTRAILGG
jgi:hypothetical protein